MSNGVVPAVWIRLPWCTGPTNHGTIQLQNTVFLYLNLGEYAMDKMIDESRRSHGDRNNITDRK